MLDYKREGSLSWTANNEVCRVGPRAGRFMKMYGIPKTVVEYVHDI